MENTLFINISDIHVRSENKERITSKLKALIRYLSVLSIDNENIFILVSGDITYSGKHEEYEYVYGYFEELATKYHLIMCPGNHDHDFSVYKSIVRSQLLKADIDALDDYSIDLITEGMAAYYKFENSLNTFKPNSKNKLCNSYILEFDKRKVGITTFNTAWCSQLHEKGGDMSFPTNYIIEPPQCDINITMLHHPLSWLEPNNHKQLRNILRERSNIVITGHEHIEDNLRLESESNKCLMLEAMSFDDEWSKDNGFLTFKFEENDVLIRNFKWDNGYFKETKQVRQSEIIKSTSISIHNYIVKIDYLKAILDIGVNFIHPDRDDLTLEDVFIYPNLKKIDGDSKLDMKKLSSDSILSGDKKKVILIGDEYCGKSTLLKKYFLDAAKKSHLPLSIDCSTVKRAGLDYDKIIQRFLELQYENLSLTDFVNTKTPKIALIDSFDLIRGDRKSVELFLDKTAKVFDRIIISISDSFDFNGSELIGENYFDESYEKFEILRLGYKLRYDLVHKWNLMKEECSNENKILLAKNDLAFKTISRIIGRNYIPSTPFFLLTMLQSMENGNSLDVNASSYGYYYEYLITHSLGSASVRKEELDEFFNYVKELSFHYFTNNFQEETRDNLFDFNIKFCQDYGVRIDFETRISLLVKAKIMEKKDGGYYKFKYPYVYYFFIAKHLAETIREDNTIEIINGLVSTLGKRRSMSILMFLTHHSRDESILDKVVEQAKSLFKNNQPTKLDLNIKFINDIIDALPKLNFQKQDRFQLRRDYEDQRDNLEESNNIANYEEDEHRLQDEKKHDAESGTDLLKEMNLTFKSLEILGQLSRNYYGSLKVPQKSVCLVKR
ncbi:metallophosphoesterase [Pantoea cypripedii]|uniref:STAND family AAA ATPase n=1 Tax=Pantoea cypripedii TaxID=55209 RepID=UPI002FC89838